MELVGVDSGLAEFGQGGGPIQSPATFGHGGFDFGVGAVGELGEPGSGLPGDIELGRGPVTHGPSPLGGVDLETVQPADQLHLAGPEPADLRFSGDQFLLPRVDLFFESDRLTPTVHTRQYEKGV